MTGLMLFLVSVVAMAFSMFFSGIETGFLSVSRARVLHMVRAGGRRAKLIQEAISNLGKTTTTVLVGNNIANVVFSSANAALSVMVFPDSATAQAIWGFVAACLVLFLCEFMPKLLCAARPIARLLMLIPIWVMVSRVLAPLGASLTYLIEIILPKREARSRVTPESVLKILKDRKDGVRLSDFESALVGRIMVLRAKVAEVTPESLLLVLDNDEYYEDEKNEKSLSENKET